MSFSAGFAHVVALAGGAALVLRRRMQPAPIPAWGEEPTIPEARPQGHIPTLKMPTAIGWSQGQTPAAAAGLKVNAFAMGLDHPRWLQVLPNGDVLVAEATSMDRPPRSLFDYAMLSTMRRAAAMGTSANRITLLRDAEGDGVAELREVFLDNLNQPFGMALLGNTFYVGNTDSLVAFSYTPGETRVAGPGRTLARFKPAGHWTRSLLPSLDGRKLYIGVGSLSNIAEAGMEIEEGRAAIHEFDVATGTVRIFASGLRNPVGMAWEPQTKVLWTVVNERDGLGDETPPDYLTSVRDGGFYGWPYSYWGKTVDERVPQDAAMVSKAITPDYALGGHTASLGLCWLPAGTLPGFPDGMAIGQHGSWNRSKLSGYRFVLVPFLDGRPTGAPMDILTGFLSPDEREAFGRPVGVARGPDGSVLMADDVGNAIWRVTAA
ncbi:PQQ-dependent sugar dehydrogenase [Paracraurococcus lichenis]|uniref:Sorbosone dehydrogenase family protein n=1 Tax=Paracraurococcus lichenis TaxID=3064888 RepID=A0ABT9E9J4_9PROT|nr:sorbosone dehydrogenase family protein [Paracraurococcus sp. LOR1-02]MDO9712834.1 sorbosone dehydrogenase family protein [Paracraurococcus sp. LOR1-02]